MTQTPTTATSRGTKASFADRFVITLAMRDVMMNRRADIHGLSFERVVPFVQALMRDETDWVAREFSNAHTAAELANPAMLRRLCKEMAAIDTHTTWTWERGRKTPKSRIRSLEDEVEELRARLAQLSDQRGESRPILPADAA